MKACVKILATICVLFSLVGCAQRTDERAARLAAEAAQRLNENRFEDAYQKMRQAADLRPDTAEYQVGLGMAAVKLRNKEAAAEAYAKAERILAREVRHDPDRIDDHATVLVLLGRIEDAKRILREGYERFPDSKTLRQIASDPAVFFAGLQPYSIENIEPAGAAKESWANHLETNSAPRATGPNP